jgi:two-component system, cell cycle sensor histidine kinase and response regulator CckA
MRKITTKLLIAIGITTVLLSVFLLYQSYKFTKRQVLKDAEQTASMALNFDVAIRDYIARHVRPVMYQFLGQRDFMRETMSTSYVARKIFEDVRREFPNYIIKFSSDNPRNPLNKAGAEELKIIDYFNNNPHAHKWEGEISINDKAYFAKFSAMRMEKACLHCHGDPADAPTSLIKRYGSTAGFHRPLGKVIAVDTIAVPMVKLTQQLWPELRQSFLLIALGLTLFFMSIIFVTRFIITKRLSSITKHFLDAAQQSDYQKLNSVEIEGKDEIRDLAFSYNTLCGKLKKFYFSLETQVKDRTRELADKNEKMIREIQERKRVEEALRVQTAELSARNRELNCLLRISEVMKNSEDKSLEEILRAIIEFVPPAWRYPDVACARIVINEKAIRTENFTETVWNQTGEIVVDNRTAGVLEVCYLKELPEADEGPFLKIEKQLIGALAERIGKIIERKQAKEGLLESEALFRNLVDSAPEGIFVHAEGRFLFLNPSMVGIFGATSAEELIGTKVMERIVPKYLEAVRNRIRVRIETGKPSPLMDQEYLRIDDSTVSVESTAVSIRFQGKDAHLVFVRDITERKQAEIELQLKNQVFEAAITANSTADSNGILTHVNKAFVKTWGFENKEEVLDKTIIEFVKFEEDAKKIITALNETEKWQGEFTALKKDGTTFFAYGLATSIKDESLNLTGYQASVLDISEKKLAQDGLRASEEKYRKLFYNAEVGMFRTRLDGSEILEANRKFLDIAGATQEEIIGRPSVNLWEDPKERDEMAKRLIADGSVSAFELKMLNKREGDVRDCLISVILYREQGILEGSIVDITDLKKAEIEKQKLETQLQQSQKMEAIGKLAGGIAHDFNNLLTTIIGNADFALDQAGENRSLYNDIEEIRNVGRQAAALTRQLLAFSRKQIIQPQILNFNEILENIKKMIRRTIGEDIEFKTVLEANLWDVKLDPGQIEQILMNLVVNSRDAMPHGGKLTVETANVELDDIYFHTHGVESRPGSYAMLAVADTGMGIDEKTQTQIFEPFFTTKERGQGTGLGLSTVYGIVKQNNGHVWVYSETGKGTTFKLYFPRIDEDEASDIDEPLDENRLKGYETILVVEDNKKLLKLTKKMLESYGYKVLTAQNANEAMETFNRDKRSIHLLLTDVVMPGVNGRRLAEQIQSKNPKVKIIYMSGYTDDTISKHGVLYDDVEFIEKPFSQKDLGLKVREVLD